MKKRGQGREMLIEAARLEFEEHGFDGTNSNAIARRAGYAPQTFYRHFVDKREIFLAVYNAWAAAELSEVGSAATAEEVVDILLNHHSMFRVFRRSLRALTVSDPEVGAARAKARLEQAHAIGKRLGRADIATIIATILKIERLCDALADGEFAACGINEAEARGEITADVLALSEPRGDR
jgi:AcrR family transcriptional regulator